MCSGNYHQGKVGCHRRSDVTVISHNQGQDIKVVPGGEQDVKVITKQEGRVTKLINQRKNVNKFNNQDGLDIKLTNQCWLNFFVPPAASESLVLVELLFHPCSI